MAARRTWRNRLPLAQNKPQQIRLKPNRDADSPKEAEQQYYPDQLNIALHGIDNETMRRRHSTRHPERTAYQEVQYIAPCSL
jgi:hypothetical protein